MELYINNVNCEERTVDWPTDVDGRIQFGIDVGKERGFIHTGDNLVVITGWRQGTNLLCLIMYETVNIQVLDSPTR